MAEGWVQQQSQIPEMFREAVKHEASVRGHSSVRTLATMAYGLLLGMPGEVRHVLYLWAHSKIARQGPEVEPQEIYDAFAGILGINDTPTDRERLAWIVTRILDPNMPLPPTEQPGIKTEGTKGDG